MTSLHERRLAVELHSKQMTPDKFDCLQSMCAWERRESTTFDPHKDGRSRLTRHNERIKLNFGHIDQQLVKRDTC